MNESMISENQQGFDSGYLEQKNQEARQIDSENKRYSNRLHYIDLHLMTTTNTSVVWVFISLTENIEDFFTAAT